MRIFRAFFAVAFLSSIVLAQANAGDGQQSLPTQSPTSRPTDETELRAIIANLRNQIFALKKENEALKKQLASPPPRVAPTALSAVTFTSRTKAYISRTHASPNDATAILKTASDLDNKISDYLATHNRPTDEIVNAMYKGDVVVGMSTEQLSLYGNLQREIETATTQNISFIPWSPEPIAPEQGYYHLTIENGLVTTVIRPLPLTGASDVPIK